MCKWTQFFFKPPGNSLWSSLNWRSWVILFVVFQSSVTVEKPQISAGLSIAAAAARCWSASHSSDTLTCSWKVSLICLLAAALFFWIFWTITFGCFVHNSWQIYLLEWQFFFTVSINAPWVILHWPNTTDFAVIFSYLWRQLCKEMNVPAFLILQVVVLSCLSCMCCHKVSKHCKMDLNNMPTIINVFCQLQANKRC